MFEIIVGPIFMFILLQSAENFVIYSNSISEFYVSSIKYRKIQELELNDNNYIYLNKLIHYVFYMLIYNKFSCITPFTLIYDKNKFLEPSTKLTENLKKYMKSNQITTFFVEFNNDLLNTQFISCFCIYLRETNKIYVIGYLNKDNNINDLNEYFKKLNGSEIVARYAKYEKSLFNFNIYYAFCLINDKNSLDENDILQFNVDIQSKFSLVDYNDFLCKIYKNIYELLEKTNRYYDSFFDWVNSFFEEIYS